MTTLMLIALMAAASEEAMPQRRQNEDCGLYLAPSTIPGAGFGMFAGSRKFRKGERMAPPDLMLSAYDLDWNSEDDRFIFLWDEYTWAACKFVMVA